MERIILEILRERNYLERDERRFARENLPGNNPVNPEVTPRKEMQI
jgi:hypothetical protein